MSRPGVSVIVCTRNRATAMVGCLAGLAAAVARSPQTPCEIILVDNGSTDGTAEVLRTWADAQPFVVKVVSEPTQGLARSRNTGVGAAEYDILAMTDDDCVVSPDYLSAIVAAHAECPRPSIVGGRVDLGTTEDLPITLRGGDKRQVYDRGAMKPGGFIIGANLTLQRAIYDRIGAFDVRFGAGAAFVASEDSDFFFRASLDGAPVVFDPRIVVRHFHGRRGLDDARKLQRGYSFGSGAMYAKHLWSSGDVARYLGRALKDAARECVHPTTGDPSGLRWLHWFRLTHLARGFFTYMGQGAPKTSGR